MSEPVEALREVTLEEGMAMAMSFQRNGHLEEAASTYRKILEVAPDHVDALHFSGVLAHQMGRSDEAVDLIERSLAVDPGQPDGYSNLGIVLKAMGRLEEATAAYQRAVDLDPNHANAYSNLGVLLKAQGKPVEAEAAYRAAIRIRPDHIDAYHNLGALLASIGRTREAVLCFCKVTTLSPAHPETRKLLAIAYCELGEREKAVAIFEKWLAEEPDNPVPRHNLAAVSGRNVPARCEDAYVQIAFDAFALSFEEKLKRLSYRAPKLVAAMLAGSHLMPSKSFDVLDAGCGTGLCGPLISGYARRLVGVDLSARMLDQAREKAVYDELVHGELTAFLRAHVHAFDVIVSADTLVYFGVLDEVVAAAAAALRPGGVMVFTVEDAQSDEVPSGYALQPHGRYVHARTYVDRALRDAGLRPDFAQAELRMESGLPVAGLVVRATKPAASHEFEGETRHA